MIEKVLIEGLLIKVKLGLYESVNKMFIIRQSDRMSSILVIFLFVGSLSVDADVA